MLIAVIIIVVVDVVPVVVVVGIIIIIPETPGANTMKKNLRKKVTFLCKIPKIFKRLTKLSRKIFTFT